MELTESIRFTATEKDKCMLNEIARIDGDTSMSATIRRLIRNEAERRGIHIEKVEIVTTE